MATEIPFIKVNQWLDIWDEVPTASKLRTKPQPFFYIFSIDADVLMRLSKVYPRKATSARKDDTGIQRRHDPERSEEISNFIKIGYPLSALSTSKQNDSSLADLQMPGWLPTAIIANILSKDSEINGKKIKSNEAVIIDENKMVLRLPEGSDKKEWSPFVEPLQIIDGQHRLYAFNDKKSLKGKFQFPVVAFFNLDISWQAYLFYTINVKPKKINASLAFDLYPILRLEEWLERSPEGAFVYREARAQEIVESVWSYSESPWYHRINMLGETKSYGTTVTQAAFIRSLIASFIKTTVTKGLGGLYGAKLPNGIVLPWTRIEQASFIIFCWQKMYNAIKNTHANWAKDIRKQYPQSKKENWESEIGSLDAAFSSKYSLISTDQGVRGFLHIINDFVFKLSTVYDIINLYNQETKVSEFAKDSLIKEKMKLLEKSTLKNLIETICSVIVDFDWRTSSEPGLSENERLKQMIFRGSGGYKELRSQLLTLLEEKGKGEISSTAKELKTELGYAAA
jgi:DGQHR domain-containing protein